MCIAGYYQNVSFKDKTGGISDKRNYRPIALASVISKVYEMALLVKLEKYLYSSDYQFGFEPKHSTTLQICVSIP